MFTDIKQIPWEISYIMRNAIIIRLSIAKIIIEKQSSIWEMKMVRRAELYIEGVY